MNPLLQITGSLRPVALTLMLLMATAAFPTPGSWGKGFTGYELSSKLPSSIPDLDSIVNHAKYLEKTASDLKEEICRIHNLCDNSNEALAENNLLLPNITERDGCLPSSFNEETCLIKIISGLQDFDIFLNYMETEMEDNRFQTLKLSTTQLANTLKTVIKKTDLVPTTNPTTSSILLSELQSLTAWSRKVGFRLILWHYTRFIQGTVRAVRYLKTRSLDA
uniref:Interleukin-6 n=1 Tax=Monodelphis domestica TaxID=13616 RepID=F7CIZ3_MONDO